MNEPTINPYALFDDEGIDLEPPTLSPEQKQLLAEGAVPFDIVAVKESVEGQYGPCLIFTAEVNGQRFKFFLSYPPNTADVKETYIRITALYEAISKVTNEGRKVGPWQLHYITMRNGRSLYMLRPAAPPPALDVSSIGGLPAPTGA